ncbi:MAG TPA: hydroxymethylglutaryl-CoA lyase [Actinobacteria bacterium]|nr:hydroxymethylglutaryl-CoA lyase [Actinomycetota bacterium]
MTGPTAQAAEVVEVGLRDGLQNWPEVVSTKDKLALLGTLLAAGIKRLELGSFVRADKVPQMADSAELFSTLDTGTRDRAEFIALVPNLRGAKAALAAGATSLRLVLSATEGHSRSNTGRSVQEGVAEAARVAEFVAGAASASGLSLTAALATSFVCPYDGVVPPGTVVGIVSRLLGLGYRTVSLADTLGRANPQQVTRTVREVRAAHPGLVLNLHLHNTYGMAMAGVVAGLDAGVRSFDASIAGVGGCPFAPGAAGNVATEDLVFMLHELGLETGISLAGLRTAVGQLCAVLGSEPSSSVSRALGWSRHFS